MYFWDLHVMVLPLRLPVTLDCAGKTQVETFQHLVCPVGLRQMNRIYQINSLMTQKLYQDATGWSWKRTT